MALVSFQGGLIRVAYPSIRTDLEASIAAMEVVSIAGLVVTIATVVIFGRLADLVGPRRIYSGGLAVFATGSVLSAIAPGTGLLAVAQAAQGLGWSMAVASSTTLLVQSFPSEMRGRAVAGSHMAVAVGLAAGPGLGGLVVEQCSAGAPRCWRWCRPLSSSPPSSASGCPSMRRRDGGRISMWPARPLWQSRSGH